MNRIIDEGLFECVITDRETHFKYELIHTTKEGHTYSVIDPYCFWPTISDYDLYLLIRAITIVSMRRWAATFARQKE